jgi:hypothetical protein
MGGGGKLPSHNMAVGIWTVFNPAGAAELSGFFEPDDKCIEVDRGAWVTSFLRPLTARYTVDMAWGLADFCL